MSEGGEIKILNTGTSSAMPHKNNPILAEKIIASSEINLALFYNIFFYDS